MLTIMSEPYTKDFFTDTRAGSIRSAEEIVPLILELVPARSVVDVGCGEGAWLAAFSKNGVLDVLGIDGDYVDRSTLQIPADRFRPADLSRPLEVGRRFDLAVSMEVAEHLPSECAASFVQSLICLAPVILFSAAIPLQGGNQHVNEEWQGNWAELFRSHDYLPVDCIRKQVWDNSAVEWWYAQNALLYVCKDSLESNATLKAEFERTNLCQLNLVHPRQYLYSEDRHREELARALAIPGLRAASRILLTSFRNSMSFRLGWPAADRRPRQGPPKA